MRPTNTRRSPAFRATQRDRRTPTTTPAPGGTSSASPVRPERSAVIVAGRQLLNHLSAGEFRAAARMAFPSLSGTRTGVAVRNTKKDFAGAIVANADGTTRTLKEALNESRLSAPELENVWLVAGAVRNALNVYRDMFDQKSDHRLAIESNWDHMLAEMGTILSDAKRDGDHSPALANRLIASLMSDAMKVAGRRSVLTHDIAGAVAWTTISSRLSGFDDKRKDDVYYAILEHQLCPPDFMSRFVGAELRERCTRENLGEALTSLQAKIANPYETADGTSWPNLEQRDGRWRLKLSVDEQRVLSFLRGSIGWHVPAPDRGDTLGHDIVYHDIRSQYVHVAGLLKYLVGPWRGVGSAFPDPTIHDVLWSLVAKTPPGQSIATAGQLGPCSLSSALSLLPAPAQSTLLRARAQLLTLWNTAVANLLRKGGWVEQKYQEYHRAFREDNPLALTESEAADCRASGHPRAQAGDFRGVDDIPYFTRPLKYPPDNKPLHTADGRAALATLTPRERHAIHFHLNARFALARELCRLSGYSPDVIARVAPTQQTREIERGRRR